MDSGDLTVGLRVGSLTPAPAPAVRSGDSQSSNGEAQGNPRRVPQPASREGRQEDGSREEESREEKSREKESCEGNLEHESDSLDVDEVAAHQLDQLA
jgi:hypothetical protein